MDVMTTRLRAIAILTLLGTPSYLLCFWLHVCMAGHMQHPPYAFYDWINDCWWMASFASVCVFSLRLRARGKRFFFYGSLLLMICRLPLGSLGGGTLILELPTLILLDAYAVKYLRKSLKYVIAATGPADPQSEIPNPQSPVDVGD